MNLSDAEIQLLACVYAALIDGKATDAGSLESSAERYWLYRQDFSQAYGDLIDKDLLEDGADGYRLTEAGKPMAQQYFSQRPDHYYYYYREFYSRAHHSAAHSKLCDIAFGLDLTQEGQLDMDGVEDLMRRLDLRPGMRLLDLGCGAGGIAEYLSDQTGAQVTGVDYSAAAIEVARERTADKAERVNFVQADLNHLDLDEAAFDAAVMIDSVYWIADTAAGLKRILDLLKPGGQLIILIALYPQSGADPAELDIDATFVAKALDRLRVEYRCFDQTRQFLPFWQRIDQALDMLHQDFIAEGNEIIYQSLRSEARDDFLPAIESGQLRRYLYQFGKPG